MPQIEHYSLIPGLFKNEPPVRSADLALDSFRPSSKEARMVGWEDAKAVFVEVDECESGWMALADVGGALQR